MSYRILQSLTMSKINKNHVPVNIQLYKGLKTLDDVFTFINDWLPRNYSREVKNLLSEDVEVDTSYIRQVKREKINNPKIVYAMYRVAQFHKYQLENI